MDGATPATQIETEADRTSSQCPALWEAAAGLGQRGCPASLRMEESSLAGRQQRLAGVQLLGSPGSTFPRISRGPRGGQTGLAVGGVARRNRGSDQVLLLRSARRLQSSSISTSRQSPMEDRAGLPTTQGGTWSASL